MAEQWLYWVCFILQRDGKMAFHGQPVGINHCIDSPEMIDAMVEVLTKQHVDFEPEPGVVPLVPVTWHLITAKKGAGVKELKPKRKGNGRDHY